MARNLMADVDKPLAGINVVEIGHSVAAPYAGLILADLGARVIKVENPDSMNMTGGQHNAVLRTPVCKGATDAE